jgi:hypothetical protein
MSNKTPFLALVEEILEHGQKGEALSLKQLAVMIDMESTFHTDWLKDIYVNKSTSGHQATKIRQVLTQLAGDIYTKIVEDAAQSNAKIKTEPDLILRKQIAVNKRNNLDNRTRYCIEALPFFRVHPLNKDGLKINNLNKTASFVTSEGVVYKNLTFADLREMGIRVAAAQNWTPAPKPQEASGAATTVVKDGQPIQEPSLARTEDNASKLFEATVRSVQELVHKTELASISDQGMKQLLWLTKTCMRKLYADSKGKIKLEDLALDFSGVFVSNDGKTISLADSKAQISTNPEDRQAA